jgi:hypothetical protein
MWKWISGTLMSSTQTFSCLCLDILQWRESNYFIFVFDFLSVRTLYENFFALNQNCLVFYQ